jgi:prepilin-type N-terminal cleavage/methylation domain-containing protein
MKNESTPSGFTLVELLVVISIIALLLSILMPALNKVREAGRMTVCTSNARQCALLFDIYVTDNSQTYPLYAFPVRFNSDGSLGWWTEPMSTAFSAARYSYWPLALAAKDYYKNGKSPKYFFCPSQINRNQSQLWSNVSFGYNHMKFGTWSSGYSSPIISKQSSIKNPCSTLLLCESRYVPAGQTIGRSGTLTVDDTQGWACEEPPKTSLNFQCSETNTESKMANRHPYNGNKNTSLVSILWADGHSTKEKRMNIYPASQCANWGFQPDRQ